MRWGGCGACGVWGGRVLWCPVVRRGAVCGGVVRCVVWGAVGCGVVRYAVWWGAVGCGVCGVWCGVVWCGGVWCGVVWCGGVGCGGVSCGTGKYLCEGPYRIGDHFLDFRWTLPMWRKDGGTGHRGTVPFDVKDSRFCSGVQWPHGGGPPCEMAGCWTSLGGCCKLESLPDPHVWHAGQLLLKPNFLGRMIWVPVLGLAKGEAGLSVTQNKTVFS